MKKLIAFLILNCSSFFIIGFAQSDWEIIPSGTNQGLNSIFFYDYKTGFACGDSGTVIKSVDSGKTWQTLQTPVSYDLNDLYVFNDSTVCVVGNYGTLIFTTDGGNYWFGGASFVTTEDYLSISFSGSYGICAGSSQTIMFGTFNITSVNFIIAQTGFFGGGFWSSCMLSPEIGFVAGDNSIFQPLLGRSSNFGQTWDFTSFYLNNNEGRATGVDFTDQLIGYISASVWDGTGAISKTTNGGFNWNTSLFNNPLWGIDFPISNSGLIGYAVGNSGLILKTTDAGLTWQQQISGTALKLNKVQFKDFNYGFIVGENGLILKTMSGGNPIPVELLSFSSSVVDDDVTLNWMTATETNNSGFQIERRETKNERSEEWNTIGFVNGNGTTTDPQTYSFKDENLAAGKYQYRLKQIDFDGTFEYSNIVEAEILPPAKFSLEQNYPNPFNPSTSIQYSLASRQFVTLKIFNSLGEEIETLVNEYPDAGVHSKLYIVHSTFPSGVYYYQLKAGEIVQTKKMILIK